MTNEEVIEVFGKLLELGAFPTVTPDLEEIAPYQYGNIMVVNTRYSVIIQYCSSKIAPKVFELYPKSTVGRKGIEVSV